MKNIFCNLLLAVSFFAVNNLHAQSKTGQICFIRATGYVGSAINYRAFIDDSLACKLKNKSYSLHTVAIGEHAVAVSSGGLSSGAKSAPLKINVEEGKTTYVDLVWANSVSCQELTQNSGQAKIKPLKENLKCSSAE